MWQGFYKDLILFYIPSKLPKRCNSIAWSGGFSDALFSIDDDEPPSIFSWSIDAFSITSISSKFALIPIGTRRITVPSQTQEASSRTSKADTDLGRHRLYRRC